MIIIAAFMAAVTWGIGSAQDRITVPDWVRVDVCHITLLLPPELKPTDQRGIDSCVAEFADGKMWLYIDYGLYGGAARKNDVTLEFKEKPYPSTENRLSERHILTIRFMPERIQAENMWPMSTLKLSHQTACL